MEGGLRWVEGNFGVDDDDDDGLEVRVVGSFSKVILGLRLPSFYIWKDMRFRREGWIDYRGGWREG